MGFALGPMRRLGEVVKCQSGNFGVVHAEESNFSEVVDHKNSLYMNNDLINTCAYVYIHTYVYMYMCILWSHLSPVSTSRVQRTDKKCWQQLLHRIQFLCIHIYIYTRICTCVCIYIYVYVYVYMYSICTQYFFIYLCAYIYIYIYINLIAEAAVED